MMIKKAVYTIFFCLGFLVSMAQPRDAKTETVNGKEFYVHTVKKGETLYEIAKMYKAPLSDVLNNNPGKENKIDIGDKIKIPVTDRNKPRSNSPRNDTHTATNNTPLPQKLYTIEHTVEKGETVYGIARKYKTTPEEIYELNPEAKNGISTGQVLKIQTTEKPAENNGNHVTVKEQEPKVLFEHTVQPQETFFSLSRKYNISQDSIRLLNNGLPDGLKAGNVITLAAPASKLALFKSWETAAPFTNNNNGNTSDTTYNNTTPVQSVFKTGKKEIYNIGVMVPLQLDRNDKYMSDQNAPDGKRSLYEPTRQALDFQLGVMLAADSLRKAGISANIKVFDIGRDTSACRKVNVFAGIQKPRSAHRPV